jgi:sugar/nucleoside kinase (ribokinase family)
MTKPPLLCLGYANVDLVASVPHLPTVGERVTASPIEVFPGGMAANAACAAANLGAEVFFFGNVGQDDYGKIVLEAFRHDKVHTEHITSVKRTTVSLITLTPEGERAIVSEPSYYYGEKLRAWLESYQESPGFLYTDGYHLCAAQHELAIAKAKGFMLYCDFDGALDSYSVEEIFQTLESVDILQITHDLLLELTKRGSRLEQLRAQVPTVIVTNGGNEVVVYSSLDVQRFPVPKVPVVSTTGAGDCFAGSLLAAYQIGQNLASAVNVAIHHASELVQVRGSRLA